MLQWAGFGLPDAQSHRPRNPPGRLAHRPPCGGCSLNRLSVVNPLVSRIEQLDLPLPELDLVTGSGEVDPKRLVGDLRLSGLWILDDLHAVGETSDVDRKRVGAGHRVVDDPDG